MLFGFLQSTRDRQDVFELLRGVPTLSKHWFVSCGKKDGLYGVNVLFAAKLKERGIAVGSMSTDGGHDWPEWHEAMPELMKEAGGALR